MQMTIGIVTVCGPGGCDKSRVAGELIELATSYDPPRESRHVEVSAVGTVEQVVDVLLWALGCHSDGKQIECVSVLTNCPRPPGPLKSRLRP